MGNHLHVIVRTRPDVAAAWSGEELAERWWRLFPRRRDGDGGPAEPQPHELAALVAEPKVAAERRRRLASLSWLMRCLSEPIARRANREDGCTGRFWEGRFKSQALLDDAAVLACCVYVDLNPVRAAVAEKPEQSEFTSAYDRIVALRSRRRKARSGRRWQRRSQRRSQRPSADADGARDGWLCPMRAEEAAAGRPRGAGRGDHARRGEGMGSSRRASSESFLAIAVEDYLRLLDWTGRQVRRPGRAAIPASLTPILDRLRIGGESWVEGVENFGRWFHRAVGRTGRLAEEASRRGRRWFQGLAHARAAFG